MKILAIDLAWSGKTGWVLWGEEVKAGSTMAFEKDGNLLPTKETASKVYGFLEHGIGPIYDYGEFQPKRKSTKKTRVRIKIGEIYDNICQLVLQFESNSGLMIAYEQTDWHQPLSGKDYKQKYAQERRVQRCLGRAEATLLLAAMAKRIEAYAIGATEAKREFGAMRKDAVARLLANEYPDRLEFREDLGKDAFLWDLEKQQLISHHISDAMVVASVVSRRLHAEEQAKLGN